MLTGITDPAGYRNAVLTWAATNGVPSGSTYEQMLGAYQGSNPMPGETPDQFRMRILGNLEGGGNVAPTGNDFGYTYTSDTPQGYTPFNGVSPTWQAQQAQQSQNDAKLEEQRRLAEQALARQEGLYQQGPQVELRDRILNSMRGNDAPFTPDVVNGLIAQETDASASGLASQQDLIRQAMANSGMSGSGLQASAMANAQRAASKRSRGASRDIRTRAELENYQARERAQTRASALFAQQEAAERAARMKEVDFRSRFEVTGDAGLNSLANAIGSAQNNGASPGAVLPSGYSGRVTGNPQGVQGQGSSYGGVTFLNGASVDPFIQSTSTRYAQQGLGGAAGPWGAIEAAHNAAGDRTPDNRSSYKTAAERAAESLGQSMLGGIQAVGAPAWYANAMSGQGAATAASPQASAAWGAGGALAQAAQRSGYANMSQQQQQDWEYINKGYRQAFR